MKVLQGSILLWASSSLFSSCLAKGPWEHSQAHNRNDFEVYHEEMCADVGGGFKSGVPDPRKPQNGTEEITCVIEETNALTAIRFWGTASYCRGYYWDITFCEGDDRWEVKNDGHCHETSLRYGRDVSVGLVCTNDEPPRKDDP